MARKRNKSGRSAGTNTAAVRVLIEGEPLTLHKSSGQAYFRLPDEHGRKRRFYQGRFYADPRRRVTDAATLQRAASWLREYRVLGGPPPKGGATALTVAELVRRFTAWVRDYYGEGASEIDRFGSACAVLVSLYGPEPAEQFGPLALKAVRAQMVERGWTRKTVNAYVQRVRRAFRWACSNELLPVAVYQALTTVDGLRRGRTDAPEGGRVLPVSDADVEATLPHVSRPVAAMIQLQRLTGMRPGEAVILRPCDVDRSGDVWVYRPESHKNAHRGHDRAVYLGPRAQTVLKPFLLRAADQFAFSAAEAEEERLAAREAARRTPAGHGNFRGSNRVRRPERAVGDRYTVASYRRAVNRAAADAGVERWSPNRLRHTRGTEVGREFGIEAARVALGHADVKVTQLYAERDDELARRVAAETG